MSQTGTQLAPPPDEHNTLAVTQPLLAPTQPSSSSEPHFSNPSWAVIAVIAPCSINSIVDAKVIAQKAADAVVGVLGPNATSVTVNVQQDKYCSEETETRKRRKQRSDSRTHYYKFMGTLVAPALKYY